MKPQPIWPGWGLLILIGSLLAACGGPEFPQQFEDDRTAFMQSLSYVEAAGEILQNPKLNDAVIESALMQMDKGLQQAWKVREGFLNWVDPTLRLSYQSWLITGVENYRLGVTAGDPQQQQSALKKLLQWQQFWSRNRERFEQRMQLAEASSS